MGSSGMYHDQPPSGLSRVSRFLFLATDGRIRPGLRALLFLFLAFVLTVLLERAVMGFSPGPPSATRYAVTFAALNAIILLQSWFLLSVLDHRSFRTLGLSLYPGWGRETVLGLAFGAGLITLMTAILVATGLVSYHGLGAGAGTLDFLTWAGVLLLAAAYEEILFRGYAFQRLAESATPLGAIVIFSMLFGAGHIGNPSSTPLAVANTVLAGVLLAVAYLKTRALWLPIALHWAWNYLMGPILSLPVSGFSMWRPIFVVEVQGPGWLSGGAYGPEGSVLLTFLCAVAILALLRTKRLAPSPAMQEILKIEFHEATKGVQ